MAGYVSGDYGPPNEPRSYLPGNNMSTVGSAAKSGSSKPSGMSNTLNNFAAQAPAGSGVNGTDLQISQALAGFAGAKSGIYGQYSYLTGGPNWALINQLRQQRKETTQRYKTNRADVENMYGQLSADVEADTQAISKSFDTGITDSATRAQGVVGGLSGELAAQQERRNRAANELGVGQEAILSDYGSTNRLNEAMGTVLGQNQNWQGLLQSQKGVALQQGANVKAGVGNTQNMITTDMKKESDRIVGGLNNAIRSEKSRQAVRKLTEEGVMLMGMEKSKLKSVLQNAYGLSKTESNKLIKNQEESNTYFDKYPSAKYGAPSTFTGEGVNGKTYTPGEGGWNSMMRDVYGQYISDKKNAKKEVELDSYLDLYGKQVGISPSNILPEYTNLDN
jgi:hypothetical protein